MRAQRLVSFEIQAVCWALGVEVETLRADSAQLIAGFPENLRWGKGGLLDCWIHDYTGPKDRYHGSSERIQAAQA